MNNPNPVPPAPSAGTATNVAPSLGALVGTMAGLAVCGSFKLNPLDPSTGGAITTVVGTGVCALFHWLGQKTGIPGLG